MSAFTRRSDIWLPGPGALCGKMLADSLATEIRRKSTAYTPEFGKKHGMRQWSFVVLAYRWPRDTKPAANRKAKVRFQQLRLPL
jgi:hypothetical protein